MKKIFVLLISLFTFNSCVLADSVNFNLRSNINYDENNNQASVIVGFSGTEINEITHKMGYDSKKMELIKIYPSGNFDVEYHETDSKGKWMLYDIKATSEDISDSNYIIMLFQIKDNFKGSGDIFLYEYNATGPLGKYRNVGNLLQIKKDENGMYISQEKITKDTKNTYFVLNNLVMFIIIIISVVTIIVGILVYSKTIGKRVTEVKINKEIGYNDLNPFSNDDLPVDNNSQAGDVLNPFSQFESRIENTTNNYNDNNIDYSQNVFENINKNQRTNSADSNNGSVGHVVNNDDDELAVVNPTNFENK